MPTIPPHIPPPKPANEEQWQNMLDAAENFFRIRSQDWRMDRFDEHSEPMTDSLRDLIAGGIRGMMQDLRDAEENREALNKIKKMPHSVHLVRDDYTRTVRKRQGLETFHRHMVARSVSAIELEHNLRTHPDLVRYAASHPTPGEAMDSAVEALIGSAIRIAVDASPHVTQKIGSISTNFP